MNSRIVSTVVGLIIVAAVGGYVYSARRAGLNSLNSNINQSPRTIGYSLTQVGEHNGRASCWSVINGSVYDLTNWISNHPGGEQNILNICGIDGSTAFNAQHGNNSKVLNVLAGFKIGNLTP